MNTIHSLITPHDSLNQQQIQGWLTLQHAPGFGPAKLRALIERNIDPLELLGNQQKQLTTQLGLPTQTVHGLNSPNATAIENDWLWAQQPGCYIIPYVSSWYPPLLREISDAPLLLFARGDPELLHYPQLAIVGSRNPSRGGAETAFEFSRYLSNAGLIITSGMATGIDTVSHQGALAGSELTVAVAGTGLDRVYPARNQPLAESIVQHGTLVSEFSIGTPALAANFPRRNRIISGLSLGVLVVEAAKQSGSLITAHQAMEQGREVFAIPGSIHNPLARGCHALLRQGAKLVETAEDILQELAPLLTRAKLQPQHSANKSTKHDSNGIHYPNPHVSEAQTQLLSHIEHEPISVDALVQRTRLTPESISSMLVELELYGIIQSSGGLYSRL